MPTGTLAPNAVFQAMDTDGHPLPGARLLTYLSGTSTPDPIYHDAGLTTAWPNPAIADAGGFFSSLYMGAGAQKWILQDSAGVQQWSVDPVNAVASAAGSGSGLGEVFTFGSNSSSPITATTYAAGATFDKLHPGSQVFRANSTDLPGTYALQITGVMSGAGTLTVAIMSLDTGTPDTPLATATITSQTGEVGVSGPITWEAAGVIRKYGLKPIVSANVGFLIGASLIRTA